MQRRDFLAAGIAALAMPRIGFASPQLSARVVRVATDRFEVIAGQRPKFRILQLSDTHFGTPADEERAENQRSYALIRELVATHRPDFVFHTGDFINNDKVQPEFEALEFMNSLSVPWSMVFGNHDHPTGKAGQKNLDDYYAALSGATVGFAERNEGGRDYCFRIDLRQDGAQPFASLFAFNTGSPATGMKVNATQTRWFLDQIAADKKAGVRSPVLVMQHIPTIEFKQIFEKNIAVGRQGETVCSEIDQGEIFRHYAESQRVRAVFCGHDHKNDYLGNLHGVTLTYGRCSGYAGYGDWQRGARLIDIDTTAGRATTRVVLAKSAHEKPDWSKTLAEAGLY